MSRAPYASEVAAILRTLVRGPLAVDGKNGLVLDPKRVRTPLKVTGDGFLELEGLPAFRVRKATDTIRANFGDVILCDPSAAPFTVLLPAVKDRPGGTIVVKNLSSSLNAITIDGREAEEIDDATTHVMAAAWASRTLLAAGERWAIL